MFQEVAGIKIPDSRLAKEAADLLREHGDDLLWNHSNRVFLFGAVNGKKTKHNYDLELLYVSALFHDLGLTKKFSSPDLRFEVDGANAARSFFSIKFQMSRFVLYGMLLRYIRHLELQNIKSLKWHYSFQVLV
ncbi:hypothetical protein QFZ73_004725 [Peribacillus sp. V2I11]|nr:hypothetical protein [Peribacillus sp. V2I11]